MHSFNHMKSSDKIYNLNWRILTSWPFSLLSNGNSAVVILSALGFFWAANGSQFAPYCTAGMAEDQALDLTSTSSAHCIIQWSPLTDQQLPKGNHTTTTVIS